MFKIEIKPIDIGDFISMIIAISSLVWCFINGRKNKKLTEKFNSQEHEFFKSTKALLWELKAALTSIKFELNTKAQNKDIDIVNNVAIISEVIKKAEYMVLLYCAGEDALLLRKNLGVLSGFSEKVDRKAVEKVVSQTIQLLEKESFNNELSQTGSTMDIDELFSKLNSYFSSKKIYSVDFGGSSIDLSIDYSEYCKIDKLPNGGDFEIMVPFEQQYRKIEVKEFFDENELFINSLVYNNKIDDPNLRFFVGVLNKDSEMVSEAMEKGANVAVTMEEIKKKYHNEYEEFMKSRTNNDKVPFDETGDFQFGNYKNDLN